MKKITIAIILLLVIFGYAYFVKGGTQSTVPASSGSSSTSTSSTNSSSSTASSGTPSPSTASSQFKDGTYTGDVADAFYGNLQVRATTSGGRISDVVFLQYPNDRDDSVRINDTAMPQLKQEAIQAQSANVNVISGATQTSQAFVQTLQSALSKAQS